MTSVTVALGSNLGDRLQHLRTAVARISALGVVRAVASLYETDPVGGPTQGRYLNTALVLDTDMEAHALLIELQRIESELGRIRTVEWGPRTLDLDIVTYGENSLESDRLVVPHPRAAERGFVLRPLAEIAPEATVATGLTASAALAQLDDGGGVTRFEGDWVEEVPRLGVIGSVLLVMQGILLVAIVATAVSTAEAPVPAWQTILGLVLALQAAVLAAGGSLAMGRTLRAHPDPLPGAPLIERGPFGLVRHPIYGGLLLGGSGVVLMFNSPWAVIPLVLLAGLLDRKSKLEERVLGLVHPRYGEYRIRVPRRFIPWVW